MAIPKDSKVKHIDLQLIHDDVICRANLNEKMAFEYAELVEKGSECPPIIVYERADGSYTVGDGRTRLHSYMLAVQKTIPCIVLPKAHPADILIAAFKANYGGPAQVDFADARHTMMQLIRMNKPKSMILEAFPYPPATTLNLYKVAYRTLLFKSCAEALSAMAANPKLSMEDAARLYKLKIEELVRYQSARLKKGTNESLRQTQAAISQRFKNLIGFVAGIMKQQMKQYIEGQHSANEVQKIIAAVSDYHTKLGKNILNWQNRFAKVDGPRPDIKPSYSISQDSQGIRVIPMAAKASK